MWWLWSKALKRWSDGLLLAKTIWVVSGWLTQCITINRKLKLLWAVWTSCVINNWTTTTVFPSKLTGIGGCSNIFSQMNVIVIRFGGSFQFSGLEFLDVLVEHLNMPSFLHDQSYYSWGTSTRYSIYYCTAALHYFIISLLYNLWNIIFLDLDLHVN